MSHRFVAATLLVAAPALLALGRFFMDATEFFAARPPVDTVTQFTSRWEGVRRLLPDRGVLGYMTDEGTPPDDANAQAEFYLAQYALAPVILVRSTEPRFVVGNFHKLTPTASLARDGFQLVRDFGSGVALFERRPVAH